MGGLLEHSLSLAGSALRLRPSYPQLRWDLVVAGCFLHDLGKIWEISAEAGHSYTVQGRLWGHIYMGAREVENRCNDLQLDPDLTLELVHLILSHQGDRSDGYGSPVDPLTPEAVLLHHLDNLDAKLQNIFSAMEAQERDDPFTDFFASGPIRKAYYRSPLPGSHDSKSIPEGGDEKPQDETPSLFGPSP